MPTTSERLTHDLRDMIRDLHSDLNRVEILAAALYGFSTAVPDYEPKFRHRAITPLNRFENGSQAVQEW